MKKQSRRKFIATSGSGALFTLASGSMPVSFYSPQVADKLAVLGGKPVRTQKFPNWPIWDENDEKAILPVLRSGVWSRRNVVTEAEQKVAALMGAKYCLLTTNGTNALVAAIRALGIEGGDEVITTPWSWISSMACIFLNNALPVFVDIDPQTWMLNPDQIESRVNADSKAILAVQITGGICQMDKINAIAKKHNLRVVEDACEAHMAEWKGKKAGTLGDLGCFSLQNGKQLTCGEGGIILGDDEHLMDLCYSVHNVGSVHGSTMPKDKGQFPILGTKARMAEYQASMVITQMETLEEETRTRSENAKYLTSKISRIPGIIPRKDYPETNVTSYYYYGFRVDENLFGINRDTFIKALSAEGIPASSNLGVTSYPLYQNGMVESVISSKTYRKLYSKQRLDEYRASLDLPEVTKLCREAVGFHSNVLLGTKADIDDIYKAIEKVYENRKLLKGQKTDS
jgi:dTDP-4-amino-4,6-dideoxygalactose transaminase